MKIVIAPGAFKHSLAATEAAQQIEAGLRRSGLDADMVQLPIADGGNDTLAVMLNSVADGERVTLTVRNPLGRPVKAAYGLIDGGKTAVIEMALASGLALIGSQERNPMRASTYGTGQLMADALERGARRFIIGLGGSATVDGGSGCLVALGARLLDANGRPLLQQGGGMLAQVASVDLSGLDSRWADCEILAAVDVDNPALGPQGAAAVFGPQKGAVTEAIGKLDAGLSNFIGALVSATGRDVRDLRGGGAAGAFAAGLAGALGAELVSGSDLILSQIGFDAHVRDADWVITGEGRMDEQTIEGKGPFGAALRAQELGVRTVALVGGLGVDDAVLHDAGLTAVLPIVDGPMPLEQAIMDADVLLERAALRLGYLLQLGQSDE